MKRALPFLAPVAVATALLLAGWAWLRWYTRHNVTARVPDLQGQSVAEAEAMLAKRDLLALVIDSVHTDELPKGSVVDQDPDAGKEVKPGRTVYLTLNSSQPKMIDMPDVTMISKRQAMSVLEILGLKVREVQYTPDPKAVDLVLKQLHKGRPIEPGTRIRRGDAITLVVGSPMGVEGGQAMVPDLKGLTYAETGTVLSMAGVKLGIVVVCEGCNTRADSAFARVRRQSPAASGNSMTMGGTIDIWLTTDTVGLKPATGWNDPANYSNTDSTDAEN